MNKEPENSKDPNDPSGFDETVSCSFLSRLLDLVYTQNNHIFIIYTMKSVIFFIKENLS